MNEIPRGLFEKPIRRERVMQQKEERQRQIVKRQRERERDWLMLCSLGVYVVGRQ